jgi:hypothetical protein
MHQSITAQAGNNQAVDAGDILISVHSGLCCVASGTHCASTLTAHVWHSRNQYIVICAAVLQESVLTAATSRFVMLFTVSASVIW